MHYTILAIVAAVVWHLTVVRCASRLGLLKPNFKKSAVLASYGLIEFPYIAAVGVALGRFGYIEWNRFYLYLSVMGAMWVMGALDDIRGSREVGGFKGHFKKLLLERKLTTGAVKALGGGFVALGAGFWICPQSPLSAVLAAVVIALASNTINLFDLRPGRAAAVLFAGLVVTYIVKYGRLIASPLVGAIAVVALSFGVWDSRGKAMMGDSGSNSLGAALGLTIALSAPDWMIPAIIIMAAVHVYSEKRSISTLIEANRFLKWIDRRLGVR